MKYYTIHEFAQLTHKTPQTLRNWEKRGVLIPHHKGLNGYRYYSDEQLHQTLGIRQVPRIVIGYCRVSSAKQKDDLEHQIETFSFSSLSRRCSSGVKCFRSRISSLIVP